MSELTDEEIQQGPVIETRSAAVDNCDWGQRIITVVAVPYEQPTPVTFRGGVWNEVFERSAFAGLDVRKRRIPVTSCLQIPDRSHGEGRIVGRISETYSDRPEGYIADLKISRTEKGDETLELARDDALSVSVGFMVKNPYQDETLDTRAKTRRIHRAFLDHLAFVGQPAYPGAKVLAMRSADTIEEVEESPTPEIDKWLADPIIQWAMNRPR